MQDVPEKRLKITQDRTEHKLSLQVSLIHSQRVHIIIQALPREENQDSSRKTMLPD
jgi:hypothetical protein